MHKAFAAAFFAGAIAEIVTGNVLFAVGLAAGGGFLYLFGARIEGREKK